MTMKQTIFKVVLSMAFYFFSQNFAKSQIAEICGNGLDDDLDGYVDLFDTDCIGSNNSCTLIGDSANCRFIPTNGQMTFSSAWISQPRITGHSPLAVGDFDGDCIPEVVARHMTVSTNPQHMGSSTNPGQIRIIDGRNGLTKWAFNFPDIAFVNNGFLIADADDDGLGELYYISSSNPSSQNILPRRILCYEYDGAGSFAFLWQSSTPVGFGGTISFNHGCFFSVDIADFDQDGTPEVYSGNQIYNSLTGVEIVNGGLSNDVGYHALGASHPAGMPVAVDVLASTDILPSNLQPCGAPCEGLELVAGGTVYAVNIGTVSTMNIVVSIVDSLNQIGDGAVSVADMDLDGRLDIVSTNYWNGSPEIYVWNPRSGALLANRYAFTSSLNLIGRVSIANFDSDAMPELGVCTLNRFTVIDDINSVVNNSFQSLWSTASTDASGMTGATVYDFDGNGRHEVVYRDETNLRVFEGANGTVLGSTPCRSRTASESPIVVDVNADGQTEIICGCDSTTSYTGRVHAYQSSGFPWIPARGVWNQQAYFNVNIDDDMGVPTNQQSHQLGFPNPASGYHPLNTFLAQAPLLNNNGRPRNAAADVYFGNVSYACDSTWTTITFQLCNQGDANIPSGMPIAFYANNPFSNSVPTMLGTVSLQNSLNVGTCTTLQFNGPPNISFVYMVANDPGNLTLPLHMPGSFPLTHIAECEYSNNVHSETIDCVCGVLGLSASFSPTIASATVSLTDFSQGSTVSYIHWDFGDGTTAIGAAGSSVSHVYTSSGEFNICLSVNSVLQGNICCHDDTCIVVEIDTCAMHQAGFSISSVLSPPRTLKFTDISTPNSSISNWDFGDGTSAISNGAGSFVQHSFPSVGSYEVRLVSTLHVSDSVCCTDTISNRIRIRNSTNAASLYPSIAASFVMVEVVEEDLALVRLQLLDQQGHLLEENHISGEGSSTFGVESLAAGTYYVKVFGGKLDKTLLFVKQ